MSDEQGRDARLEALSADKRRLFELLAERRKAAPVPAEVPAISADRFGQHVDTERPDKPTIRDFFDAVNRQLDASPFGEHAMFLNYGYAPTSAPRASRVTLPPHVLNKNAIELVLELIGDLSLDPSLDVLDVGCGRGAVCSVLRRFFRVGRFTGLDLSAVAIAFCRATHTGADNSFVNGDAEALPFGDGTFDVVTNVESAHGYDDIGAFFHGVSRVLRPGGHFLYTDAIACKDRDRNERLLAEVGLSLERCQDITANVLLSCDETAVAHARAFEKANDHKIMSGFLGMPGSQIYDQMKTGQVQYLIYRHRKGRGAEGDR